VTNFPKPTWEPIALRCGKCNHNWDDWVPWMVPAGVLIAAFKSYRCPSCGGRKVFIRCEPVQPPPDGSTAQVQP
jgi:hypothetical protein